jgi:hypothetical protein
MWQMATAKKMGLQSTMRPKGNLPLLFHIARGAHVPKTKNGNFEIFFHFP